jgi:hypothetical protein
MDAFKHAEIQRMELGGNEPWKSFYDAHAVTISEGRTFEDSTIKERYEGEGGEEWKERLSCKVEGREYVPGQEKKNNAPASRSGTPMSLSGGAGVTGGARTGSPVASSIRSHDSQRGGVPTKKEQNETYFAKLGNENATRSDALPPSQGGKFTGFGGGVPTSAAGERRASPFGGFGGWGGSGGGGTGGAGGPALEDLQKDPLGTLTKGLGWFASTVGKSAKQVNESYLQPTAKQVSKLVLRHTGSTPSPRYSINQETNRKPNSWPNPTSQPKPASKPQAGAKTCKPASAAPQTNSTASSKDPTTAALVVLVLVLVHAHASNPNAGTSGTTFRLWARKSGMDISGAARGLTLSGLLLCVKVLRRHRWRILLPLSLLLRRLRLLGRSMVTVLVLVLRRRQRRRRGRMTGMIIGSLLSIYTFCIVSIH